MRKTPRPFGTLMPPAPFEEETPPPFARSPSCCSQELLQPQRLHPSARTATRISVLNRNMTGISEFSDGEGAGGQR